jgi:hypothetical protein
MMGADALGRGLFPQAQDPMLQKAQITQSIVNKYRGQDFNDPSVLSRMASEFSEAGQPELAMQLGEEARKRVPKASESPFAKINPKDYTQESLQKFAKTGDVSNLVPIDTKDKKTSLLNEIKFYTDNPDQATFELQKLAEIIAADPTNTEALDRYQRISTAASTGAQERAVRKEKEQLVTAKDRALLAKYQKDLQDAQKFGPAERWQAEKQAALNLLKNYNIDISKPLAGQVPTTILYSPIGAEITNAYERALRPNVSSSLNLNASSSPSPVSPSTAVEIDFNSLPKGR